MARLKQIGIDVQVNAAIEKGRCLFSETENDILRRLLRLPTPPLSRPPTEASSIPVAERPSRHRGLWTVELRGKRLAASSLKGAYEVLLLELDRAFPAFLEQFAQEKSRSRRFVSRTPKSLYLASPALAEYHAMPLGDGWYFDTNLSTAQVATRARVAARLCGLAYGRDVRILNHLQEI